MSEHPILSTLFTLVGSYLLVVVVVYLLTVVGWWKLFTKAGEAGWKSLIPLVNGHTLYKICWSPVFFWLSTLILTGSSLLSLYIDPNNAGVLWTVIAMALVLVLGILYVVMNFKLAKAFGKGALFGIGLMVLHTVFVLILAYGKSQYVRARK